MGFPFSEETITETILLDLASQHPGEIRIVPFNKPQEAKVGADWEWCLYNQTKNRFVRMLVQAKVLDNQDQEYAHIDRKIGNTGIRQIDRLIATAQTRGIPALFAFYNHLGNPKSVPVQRCACFNCQDCWGCSVALATATRALLPDKSFHTLREISHPWACLLCVATKLPPADSDAPGRAASMLQRLQQESREFLASSLSDLQQGRSNLETNGISWG